MLEKFKLVWSKMDNRKLVEQYIYLVCHPRPRVQEIQLIKQIIRQRKIKVIRENTILKLYSVAKSIPYKNDMVLYERIYEKAYV